MEDILFHQRSRLGAVAFELRHQTLRIKGKRGFVVIDLEVDLTDVSPLIERRRWRSFPFFAFPFGLACLCGLAVWRIPILIVTVFGGMFGLACLWTAIRNLAPIELVTFRNKSGVPVFEVIKDNAQGDEFERFVGTVITRIRKTEAAIE